MKIEIYNRALHDLRMLQAGFHIYIECRFIIGTRPIMIKMELWIRMLTIYIFVSEIVPIANFNLARIKENSGVYISVQYELIHYDD